MLRYAWMSLLAHKGRLVLTVIAIVLGVSLVTGSFVVIDTWQSAADANVHQPHRGVSVVVRGAEDGEARDPVPAALVGRVATIDGVASAAGAVVGVSQILGRDGHPITGREPTARTIDASFAGDLRAGRVPDAPSEVIIDPVTAASQHYRIGDRVRVISSGGLPKTVTVVGLLDSPQQPGAAFVGVAPGAARDLLPRADLISLVEVWGKPGTSEPELRDRLSAALGRQYTVTTETDLNAELESAAEPPAFFAVLFLIASLIALFLGTLLIRNTYTILLASRARELALLRCVGADHRQLRRMVLLEAAIVGTIASMGGLALGTAVGWGLAALLETAGAVPVEVSSSSPQMSPRTVAVAFAVGVLTAVVSAWSPARRATRVPPVAALRGDVFAVDRRAGRLRTGIGGLAGLVGTGLLLGGGLADPAVDALIRVGAVMTVLGVLVAGPMLVPLIGRLVGSVTWGATGRLAAVNAVRSPRRLAATVLPLVVGLALVGFLTTLAAGSRASGGGGFDRGFRADFQVRAYSQQIKMAPAVRQRLAALPQVAEVAAVQLADAELSVGNRAAIDVGIAGADPAALATALALHGDVADVTSGGIALRSSFAQAHGLTMGSQVLLRMADGRLRSFTIRAVYDTKSWGDLVTAEYADFNAIIPPADFQQLVGDPGIATIYATARDDVSVSTARAAIESALADQPTVEITGRDQLRQQVVADLNPALRVYYSLFGLMIVIALFGIVNTFALSVLERVQEIGILRALGMQRRQVRAMFRWEAVIVATTATGMGLAVGALIGWSTTRALNLSTAEIPAGWLALCAAGAVLAGALAGALPAQRAANISVLRAIATE